MRVPTSLPRHRPRAQRGRVWLIVAASVVFVVLVSLRGIAGFYTDWLWFDSLGLAEVWRGVLGSKVLLATSFTLAFFVVMWANLAIADRLAPKFRPTAPGEELVERYREMVGERAALVRTGTAALFALIAGAGTSAQWNAWILFNNRQDFGIADPQFDRDIGFFVFELPFLSFLVDWAFASMVIVLIVTTVAHYLNGGIRVQVPAAQRVSAQVKAHLSVLLGVLALLKAGGYWLQRYELSFSSRGVVDGASYTDVKAQLPALQLLVIISLFAAVLFLVNIRLRGWVLPIIAVGLWAFISVVVGAAYPAFIQKFRVEPNESDRERPYIQRNIEATRAAMNITPGRNVEVRDFAYDEDLTANDLDENVQTIRNVRLWDPQVLGTTYRQLQEIRRFYTFNDVDVDRYDIGGDVTQVMLSARELDPANLPSSSWENQHLRYTHGYGAVLSPANAVTTDGQPAFVIQDIPPRVTEGGPPLKQPAVYFGEGLGGYAIVNTGSEEIDYQKADGTTERSRYRGRGGVAINSFLRRAALALRFGDVNPLISGFLTSRSKAIYLRDISERVRKVAPFLRYDADPYPVVTESEGRLVWVQDAYTVSSRYPYAQRAITDRVPDESGLRGSFNYVRNSVKVVVDAYHGTMTFYVVDETDPIARAYREAFPNLFDAGDEIPADLRRHFRYPEDLFRVQTNAYTTYHITDPKGFYEKGDAWDIARDPGSGELRRAAGEVAAPPVPGGLQAVAPAARAMDPYYLLMRLPEEERESFLILQNFTVGKGVLSAFMVAKSDPNDYGRLEVFEMPRNRSVNGPTQVDARINQDPEVSPQLSLLNQERSGSRVIQGNLLVIPVEQSLLYVRPIYVEAEGTQLPELKKVVVVYGNEVALADTLRDALTDIFGRAPETREEGGGAPAPPPDDTDTDTDDGGVGSPDGAVSPGVGDALEQAVAAFERADAALRAGDLAAYQREHDEAQRLVREARQRSSPAPAPTTTAPPATTTTTVGTSA